MSNILNTSDVNNTWNTSNASNASNDISAGNASNASNASYGSKPSNAVMQVSLAHLWVDFRDIYVNIHICNAYILVKLN